MYRLSLINAIYIHRGVLKFDCNIEPGYLHVVHNLYAETKTEDWTFSYSVKVAWTDCD
jgi:hypothetical protein